MTLWHLMTDWCRAAIDSLLPRHCPVCDRPLEQSEDCICPSCMAGLPRTHFEDIAFNPMEQLFAGKVPISRAAGLYFYDKGSPYVRIIHDAKYRDVPAVGRWLGAWAVGAMRASGFFDGIDVVVPVPLHFTKRAVRGYNQTEYLARGVAEQLGCTMLKALKARAHSTQTTKTAIDRWLNTQGAFVLDERCSPRLMGRHVLLVDDVVTTGATLETCAAELLKVEGVCVSLFTLACAHLS